MMKASRLLLTTAIMLSPTVAQAQAGPAPAGQGQGSNADARATAPASEQATSVDGEQTGDIVVTANKRSELVSRTPLAVTALSGETLRSAGVVGLRDLTSTAPSVQIKTVSGVGSVQVTIRGITNTDFNSSGNPAVSTYIDGVYVARTQGLSGDLLDVSRIEVLRGPQGTLYGRNATGGNLNILTNDPTHTFGGSADLSYGNYNDVQATAVINLPISETLAIRAAGSVHRNDGLFHNSSSVSDRYGRADDYKGRLTALWTPSDSFKWRLAVDDSEQNGTPGAFFVTGPDGEPIDHRSPYRDTQIAPTISPDQHIHNLMIRSKVEYGSGPLTLTYNAGYQHLDLRFDFTNAGSAAPVIDATRRGSSTTTYHEVNLTYQGDRLTNVLGGNYFHQTEKANEAYDLFDLGGLVFASGNPDGSFLHGSSYGIFDQATFKATNRLQLIGGLRYSEERRTLPLAGTRQAFCPPGTPLGDALQQVPIGCGLAPAVTATGDFSDVTWRVGAQYDLGSTTTTYATATSGFKAGGINEVVGVGDREYAPEKNINYEVGLKTKLLDNTLRLNLAVFYTPYRNLQVTQIVGTQQLITNAARADIHGVEAEFDWHLSPNDQINGFASYLDATYKRYRNAVDQSDGQVFASLDGNRLINAPRLSGRFQYTHGFDLPNGGRLSPSVSVYAQSKVYLREFNLPVDRVGSYTKTDLTLTYADPSSKWKVQGFVDNVENNIIRNGMFNVTSNLYSDYQPPRRYGLRVSLTY